MRRILATFFSALAAFGAIALLPRTPAIATKMQPGMMAQLGHGLNANTTCRHPRINVCQGCSVTIPMKVVQDHACGFNFQSLGPFAGQEVVATPRNGTYSSVNQTHSRYLPSAGYTGQDSFETRLFFEEGSGKKTFLNLHVNVFVVPAL